MAWLKEFDSDKLGVRKLALAFGTTVPKAKALLRRHGLMDGSLPTREALAKGVATSRKIVGGEFCADDETIDYVEWRVADLRPLLEAQGLRFAPEYAVKNLHQAYGMRCDAWEILADELQRLGKDTESSTALFEAFEGISVLTALHDRELQPIRRDLERLLATNARIRNPEVREKVRLRAQAVKTFAERSCR